jgi:hypothetical protein
MDVPCGPGWCPSNSTCYRDQACLPPGASLCDGFGSYCLAGHTCDSRVGGCLTNGYSVCQPSVNGGPYKTCPPNFSCGAFDWCVRNDWSLWVGVLLGIAVLLAFVGCCCSPKRPLPPPPPSPEPRQKAMQQAAPTPSQPTQPMVWVLPGAPSVAHVAALPVGKEVEVV